MQLLSSTTTQPPVQPGLQQQQEGGTVRSWLKAFVANNPLAQLLAASASSKQQPTTAAEPSAEPYIRHHRIVYLMLVGATLGAALDWTHTDGGEIVYPPGTNHWRAILTFTIVYAIPGWVYTQWALRSGMKHPPVPFSQSGPSVAAFAAMYALSSYGDDVFGLSSTGKLICIGAAAMLYWARFDGSWQGLLGAFVTGAAGCAVEHALCEVGSMDYQTRELGRVPYWLLAIYAMSTTTWGQCCRRILTTDEFLLSAPRM